MQVIRSKAVPVGTFYAIGTSQVIVGDADRFRGLAELTRRLAIAEAVEIVRAGLAHVVPRDDWREATADLLRPSAR